MRFERSEVRELALREGEQGVLEGTIGGLVEGRSRLSEMSLDHLAQAAVDSYP